ncbi:MAG: GGDEF domain-containing protein [Treponema sp.]|nr:GGDEF domain-containing protein [Treponema sp.]
MSDKKIRIGLISDYLSSEYSENLIRGITTYCAEDDIELMLFPVGDLRPKNELYNYNFQFSAIISLIKSENLDGIIAASGTLMHEISKEEYEKFLHSFYPLKVVNIAAKFPGIPSLVVDCHQAFDALIQYLIDYQKCKRFGFMGVESQSEEVALRTQIFKDVMKRNNIPEEDIVYWKSNFEYSSAYHCLTDYRREHGKIDFDAIVALNDDTAYACIDFCTKRMNMNVPNDIIVTGFDNLQRASFSNPTLTSVNQQIEFLGYSAARTLHQYIRGKKVAEYQTIRAKTILRKSTAKIKNAQESFVSDSYITVDSRTSKDFTNSFSVSEWYTRRTQILQASNYYTSLSPSTSLQNIGGNITNNLRAFGFQAAAVVVYENPLIVPNYFEEFPLPRKVRLLAGFDYSTQFNINNYPEPYYFNPHEALIPKDLFNFPPCGTIVSSLFTGNTHYGYMILRLNDYDLAVYELIQKTTSNQLRGSFNFTRLYEEQSQMESQNKKLDLIANTDELTGLRNRRGFMELGKVCLNLSKEMRTSGLVVYCDMDGLKKINDTYGHEAGDIAIKAQAKILSKAFRSNDVLGRLGGDEFALICPGLSENQLKKIQDKVTKACKEWKKTSKSEFDLSISMGSIKYPTEIEGYKMDALLPLADNCLYLEKRAKKQKKLPLKILPI